ncbi:MAG: HAD-IA family hydrolase [Acidimicrobiia bacterium]|nr:HAD-IA family hydrolase [Acidimicrobiia bacterium]
MDFAPFGAVLFDLDGVVTPTADIHQLAWREVFEEVLPQIASEDQQRYRDNDYTLYVDGKPRYDGVASVLEAHDVVLPRGDPGDEPGMDTVCAIGNMKNEAFLRVLERDRIRPYPGAIRMIDHLDELGIPSAIVSSSRNARKVLDVAGITNRFVAIVDGNVIRDEGLAGKPDPAPFLEAARRLGVEPEKAVVMEDALSGVRAGANGPFALVVGVDREDQADALKAAGADVVVPDVGHLLGQEK